MASLKSVYPLYLNNKAAQPNTDLATGAEGLAIVKKYPAQMRRPLGVEWATGNFVSQLVQ